MITLRKSEDRGFADHGWLKSRHSFSFADYHDPAHMGFGNLRVINEDRIAAGTGFGTHAHRDMEIVSYVIDGALAHRDSRDGSLSATAAAAPAHVITPGEVQRMSAGTGIAHSEYNHAAGETHFLQIWIQPARRGIAPGYEQKRFHEADKRGRLCLVATPDGRDGAITLHADAAIHAGLFDGTERAELALDTQRLVYVHVVSGSLAINGHVLLAGDAAALSGEERLLLDQGIGAEVLVFDLAP